MRTVYFECKMGAAGDMLAGALFELLSDGEKEFFLNKVNNMGLSDVRVSAKSARQCGISGTKFSVTVGDAAELPGGHIHHHDHEHKHDHEHPHDHKHHHEHVAHHDHHHHTSLHDIEHMISHLDIPERVKDSAREIYRIIAEAEGRAHGEDVSLVHFHEVGMKDAVCDIVSVCLLLDMIAAEQILCSPINLGSGHVHCAHGVMPVPAPAVANILTSVPTYSNHIDGELCTPTGAAILKYFAKFPKEAPTLQLIDTGYGMGTKEFDTPNCVRVMLADTGTDIVSSFDSLPAASKVLVLSCNIDDMTGEEAGFALEAILEAGAREAYYQHVIMKKSRPGLLLTVITTEDQKDKIVSEIFKHTSTIGIRECPMNRYVLDRTSDVTFTDYGEIRKKVSSGYGVTREKWEYEDLAKIAKQEGLSLSQLKSIIEAAAPKS